MTDKVRAVLESVIEETAKEKDFERFLQAAELYLTHYGGKQERVKRIERFMAKQQEESEKQQDSVYFPPEGHVTGEQAAKFLGYGDLKNPASKVRRLANEGQLPQPIRDGTRALKWRAEDIRKYVNERGEGLAV